MADEKIAKLIAERLKTGLVHPGDPARDIAPTPIALPFRTAGQPKEMADLIDGTVKMLSEAIVDLIETDGNSEIVGRTEAVAMRKAVGEGPTGPQVVPLFCHCDSSRSDPLAMLTATDPDMIVVDGKALIRAMHKREIACPHKPVTP